MTEPEAQEPAEFTIVELRLQLLALLMTDVFASLLKDQVFTLPEAAGQIVKAADVLETYVLGMVDEESAPVS